jgi:hypothetical protein
MSSLSLGSPGNSPQLGSPGHLPPHHQQSFSYSGTTSTHFGFNSGTIGAMGGALACLASSSSLAGSPGAAPMMPPPPSPSHVPSFGQPPPPLPPRSHRRRESYLGDSPQQVCEFLTDNSRDFQAVGSTLLLRSEWFSYKYKLHERIPGTDMKQHSMQQCTLCNNSLIIPLLYCRDFKNSPY